MKIVMFTMMLAGTALAQTTQPGNGFAMTDQQIKDRMAELNKRATSQPAPAAGQDELGRIGVARAAMEAGNAARLQNIQDFGAAQREVFQNLRQIDQQIALIDAQGRPLEAQWANLQRQEQAEVDAVKTSVSDSYTSGDLGSNSIHTVATDNGAVELVKARYDTKFADLKAQIDALYLPKQKLLTLRAQWNAAWAEALNRFHQANRLAKDAELSAASREAARQWQVAAQTAATQPTTQAAAP